MSSMVGLTGAAHQEDGGVCCRLIFDVEANSQLRCSVAKRGADEASLHQALRERIPRPCCLMGEHKRHDPGWLHDATRHSSKIWAIRS